MSNYYPTNHLSYHLTLWPRERYNYSMSIILKELDPKNDAFLALLNKPTDIPRAMKAVHLAVQQSFESDRSQYGEAFSKRVQTNTEMRRRIKICMDWFQTLRMDFGYTLVRTMDELPFALEKTLSGGTYVPTAEASIWMPKEQ